MSYHIEGPVMLTTKQAAARLNLSTARVKWLCGKGRIPGVVKFGSVWAIPDDFVVTTVKKGRPCKTIK